MTIWSDISSTTVIQDGPVITEAIFNYIPISQAFDVLAEKAGFWWVIDENKRLWFMTRSTNIAPWIVTGDNIKYRSISVEHGNSYYRNKQYIRGGTDETDLLTETKTGDGES